MEKPRFSIQVHFLGSLKFHRVQALYIQSSYINGLLNTLMNYAYAISINGLSLSSSSFADDVSFPAT